MSDYARYYRSELRTADFGLYRFCLRLALTLLAWSDKTPRFSSALLLIFSIWGIWYIFMNYHFTQYI